MPYCARGGVNISKEYCLVTQESLVDEAICLSCEERIQGGSVTGIDTLQIESNPKQNSKPEKAKVPKEENKHPKEKPACLEEGCIRIARAKGLCNICYQRIRQRKRKEDHKRRCREEIEKSVTPGSNFIKEAAKAISSKICPVCQSILTVIYTYDESDKDHKERLTLMCAKLGEKCYSIEVKRR